MSRHTQRGFSLLELAVVVCLIAILVTLAIDRLWALRADAERVAVAHTVGAIRSGLGIEVARRAVRGGLDQIAALEGSNPVTLLAQKPDSYVGELADPDPAAVAAGRWYFDTATGLLVYRVRFEDYVETTIDGAPRLRFRVELRYSDRNDNGRFDAGGDEVNGLDLVAIDPYRWKETPPVGKAVTGQADGR